MATGLGGYISLGRRYVRVPPSIVYCGASIRRLLRALLHRRLLLLLLHRRRRCRRVAATTVADDDGRCT